MTILLAAEMSLPQALLFALFLFVTVVLVLAVLSGIIKLFSFAAEKVNNGIEKRKAGKNNGGKL